MAAGQDSEAIIATLEEAKVKLGEAQRHTFAGLTRLGKIRSSIEFTLGRLGRGNPAITLLRDAEKSIKDRAVEINALSARVDKAIAEIREAAGGGRSAPSPGPAPSEAVPAGRLQAQPVAAGDTPVPVDNEGGGVPVPPFVHGQDFEWSVQMPKGTVGMLAEVNVTGRNVTLSNVVVYGDGPELTRGSAGAAAMLKALRGHIAPSAAAQGFESLTISGVRLTGPVGHRPDFTLDLKKYAGTGGR